MGASAEAERMLEEEEDNDSVCDKEKIWTAVRVILAVPANVLLWSGIWILLDIHVCCKTSYWKEIPFALTGLALMLTTHTFFWNAYMDEVDSDVEDEVNPVEMESLVEHTDSEEHDGDDDAGDDITDDNYNDDDGDDDDGVSQDRESMGQKLSFMRESNASRKSALAPGDWAKFYLQSLVAFAGVVLWWIGTYNLLNDTLYTLGPPAFAVCGAAGAAAVMWCEASTHRFRRKYAKIMRQSIVRVSHHEVENYQRSPLASLLAHGVIPHFKKRPLAQKARLYARGLLGNLGAVLYWWGLESALEWWFTGVYDGIWFFLAGTAALVVINRLWENVGMEARPSEVPRRHSQLFQVDVKGIRRLTKSCSDSLSGWIITSLVELVAVLLVWQGIQWYVYANVSTASWLEDTLVRDFLYVAVGFIVLLATGTWVNLSGMVSPLTVHRSFRTLRGAHHSNRPTFMELARESSVDINLST